jgi:WD40 repeat protein
VTALEKNEGQLVRVVRVFVSSPGDVAHERRRVDRVTERLNGEFAGIVRIETITQSSFHGAQAESPAAADCDVVIAIFWSQLDAELPGNFPRIPDYEPYPSATAYDVLTAMAARRGSEHPDIFVFRKSEPPHAAIDDDAELERAQTQWKRLRSFFEQQFPDPRERSGVSVHGFENADQFEGQVDALLREWLEDHVLLSRSVVWPIAIKGSPFRGLASFDLEHAPVFFGRAGDVTRAVERLNAASERKHPFLLVVGPSGAGKSSLVRAGLVPRLTAAGVAAKVDVWRVAVVRPGSRPSEALAEALTTCGIAAADGGATTPAESAAQPILRALDRVGADGNSNERPLRADLLLVVDPLDDLFGADVSAADRTAFAGLLRALVASGRVWVVATLRAALYERFLAENDLATLKQAGADHELAAPGVTQLAEIVRKPADAAGLVYETDAAGERLDERILRDAAGVDTLPQMQFALQRLFIDRQIAGAERRLTFAAYDALGGIDGAVDRAAERALAAAGEGAADALPRLLRKLTVPVLASGSTAVGRATLASRAATLIEAAPDAATRRLVDALVEARILLHSKEHGVPTIRLAHPSVLETWQRARGIVAGNLEFLRRRDEAEDRRARLRQKVAMAAAAVFAAAAVVAGWQYLDARAARQEAVQSASTAVADRGRADEQRQLAEERRKDAEEQRAAARQRQGDAEQQHGIARQRQEAADSRRSLAENNRRQAEEQRDQALVAQSRFLAELADRTLRAGDDMTAVLLALEALPDEKSGAARPLVSEAEAGLDRALRGRKDERVPREAQVLSTHAGSVRSCALSGDGARAVTASADRIVRIWDARTGEGTTELGGHAADVAHVSFSAEGSTIVSAAEDGLRVWDAAAGTLVASLPQQRNLVAVSADGRGVISSSVPNRVHLWDRTSGQEVTRTLGGNILAVRFGPEGARVAAGTGDNSIEIHEAASGRRLRVLRGHWRKPLTAAFSPDGQRVASIGDDQTARIWGLADGRQMFFVADPKLSRDVAIRPGAERALVPLASGWRLYAINGTRLLADLPGADGGTASALLGPGEKLIVTAAGSAKLWDGVSGKDIAALEQGATTTCIGISRDGRQLLTGTRDGIARVWSFDRNPDPVGQATPTARELVEIGKAQVRRCLTREQRVKAFLAPEPPAWCIELAKWPYDTQAWKDWLRYKRDSADPPRPDTPEWQSWLASASALPGESK